MRSRKKPSLCISRLWNKLLKFSLLTHLCDLNRKAQPIAEHESILRREYLASERVKVQGCRQRRRDMQINPGITFRKFPIYEGVGSDCKAMLAAVCWNWASIWQHCVWNGLPWLHSWQATVGDDFTASCVIRGLYIGYRRPNSSQSATDSGRCVLFSELTVSEVALCFLLKMCT